MGQMKSVEKKELSERSTAFDVILRYPLASVLTAIYVGSSFIGWFYGYRLLSKFNVNFSNYIEPSDLFVLFLNNAVFYTPIPLFFLVAFYGVNYAYPMMVRRNIYNDFNSFKYAVSKRKCNISICEVDINDVFIIHFRYNYLSTIVTVSIFILYIVSIDGMIDEIVSVLSVHEGSFVRTSFVNVNTTFAMLFFVIFSSTGILLLGFFIKSELKKLSKMAKIEVMSPYFKEYGIKKNEGFSSKLQSPFRSSNICLISIFILVLFYSFDIFNKDEISNDLAENRKYYYLIDAFDLDVPDATPENLLEFRASFINEVNKSGSDIPFYIDINNRISNKVFFDVVNRIISDYPLVEVEFGVVAPHVHPRWVRNNDKVRLLFGTSKYFFFLNESSKRLHVVPQSMIISLTPCREMYICSITDD